MSRFLVTGASGYIALHTVDQLLKQGYFVRGTVRSLKDEKKTEPIRNLAKNTTGQLELVEADLLNGDSWKKAVESIDIILHIASPLPLANPSDEQEVIRPAVEGTLNVLNAALNTSVKRVVVTSSGLAIMGYNYIDKTFSEIDWADVTISDIIYPIISNYLIKTSKNKNSLKRCQLLMESRKYCPREPFGILSKKEKKIINHVLM